MSVSFLFSPVKPQITSQIETLAASDRRSRYHRCTLTCVIVSPLAFSSRSYESHKDAWERDHEASTTRISDRLRIQQVLAEVGLNPSNYLLSPPPDGRSPHETVPSHTSAFSAYPSQQRRDSHQPLLSQPHSQFTSARPLSYGQLPAPPPPLPPPPPPPANADTSSKPNPEPAPASSGSALPSFLFGRSTSQPPATSSQPVEDMSHHSYSRRTPPLPPDCISHPHDSSISAEHYLRQVNSNECPPVKVVKPCTQNVVYKKEIRIRYLQPPTPPLPAPIIIREKRVPPKPPQSVRVSPVAEDERRCLPLLLASADSRAQTRGTHASTVDHSRTSAQPTATT